MRDEQIRKNYPLSDKKIVIDQLHGIPIEDPYRWLEDIESESVSSWIMAQNDLTEEVLYNYPEREVIKDRLTQLQYRDEVLKVKESRSGLFILKKLSNKEQPVLYFQAKDTTEERVLIDVNEIDPAGTTSLDYFFPSHKGEILAYGLSEGGSEWAILHLMNVPSGELLDEKIERAKWSSVQWEENDSAFYYTRFPKPGDVPPGEEVFGSHIRLHKLGTDPDLDPVIFENPENPQEYPIPVLSPDGSFMIVTAYRFIASDLYLIDLITNPKTIPLVIESEWLLTPFISQDYVYIRSNHKSPNFGLYRAERENLQMSSWETIIEPQSDILQDVELVSDKIMALWLHDVKSKVTLHEPNGVSVSEIILPMTGTIDPTDMGGGFSGGLEYSDVYFNCMSFFQPQTTYQFNIPSGKLREFFKMDLNLDSSKYEITEEWYQSQDGTRVHMFLIHSSQLALTGDNPTILYGYGGFNVSMTPFFSPSFIYWIERGVVAVANIRGGGEHGDAWHKAGILNKKQNVFDDFIAAAEYLIQKKYCSPKTLAIMGGSNGGLLVGAATVQRPELFAAVYCAVPLLDMLRYHHFSIGKTWVPEYGDPEKPEDFQWLRAYSPYQNVREDVAYPAILFKTAINDSRVDPTHALKMTALMQNLPQTTKTTNPILLWTESEAGHGSGKSVTKLILEGTQMLSFFLWRIKDS